MDQAHLKILLGSVFLFCLALYACLHSLALAPGLSVVFTLAAVVFLELKAPSHPVYGYLPTSFPLLIYLALSPNGSVGLATVAVLASLSVRTLSSQGKLLSWKIWEFLVDGISTVSSLALLKVLMPIGPRWNEVPILGVCLATVAYYLLRPALQEAWSATLGKQRRRWELDLVNASTTSAAACFLAVPYAFLAKSEPGLAFVLPVVPLILSSALSSLLQPARDTAPQQEAAKTQLIRAQVTQLDLRASDLGFLRELTENLPHPPNRNATQEKILWMARRLSEADSVVLFLEQDGELQAVESKTAYHAEIEQAKSTKRVEPVVRRAFETRRFSLLQTADAEEGRIFSQELSALAVPLYKRGVLYLGRAEEKPFSEEEINRLGALGELAYLALRTAEASEEREQAMKVASLADREKDGWQTGVQAIQAITTELLHSRDPQEILNRIGHHLGDLVTLDYWVVQATPPDGSTLQLSGPASQPRTDPSALDTLLNRVCENSQPFLCNNLKESEWPQPSKGTRSVLGCPLLSEKGAFGALLVFSASSDAFSVRDGHLLSLLGSLIAARFTGTPMVVSEQPVSGPTHELVTQLEKYREQLVRSSKMAAVGQLAAGVAHELNGPLGSLTLAVEGACRALPNQPERAVERLQRALVSSQQLKRIVEQLLYYSSVGVVEELETDLSQVVEDTLNLWGNQLAFDDIEFRVEMNEVDLVRANQNEIQQIVMNLLTNAKDAVLSDTQKPDKRIQLTVTNHPVAVELAVSDNGVGMDEETRSQALEPFFTTKGERGTGLGLTVTRSLVEKHGGALRIQSTPGKGTRVVLRLPKALTTRRNEY